MYDRFLLLNVEAESIRQMQFCPRRAKNGPRHVLDMDSFDAPSIPFDLR